MFVTETSNNHCLTLGLPVSSVTVEFGNKGNERCVVTESSINQCLTLGLPVSSVTVEFGNRE